MATPEPTPIALRPSEALGVKLYLGTSFAVLVLMMLAGIVMRAAQAGWLEVGPVFFYQVMTVHGAGMVGIAALGGSGLMWFFLRRYVALRVEVLYVNYTLFLSGVVLILGSVFIGGYAGGWTFLWPLPAHSMGLWSAHAAAGFIGGLILIGVGFLAFYFDAAVAIGRVYGSLLKGLGLDQLISGRIDLTHPPTVVASSMVIIVNTLGTLTGAVVLIVTLVNLYFPALTINPLLAKNLIYFFGHVFINASIYMGVIAVYELLPLYAKRPWKVSRPFYAAWACATLFVMAVYPHHLLMDAVMPNWLLATGQVVSYLSGIPVLLVTTYGALLLVYRSDIEWKAPARWLMLAMFGWAAGVIPAIVDGTIQVNKVMHNTLWVPGHFHFYLLVGLLPMLIGFSLHVFEGRVALNERVERMVFWLYAVATVVFSVAFLLGGWASVPRRWAQHLEAWAVYDKLGTASAAVIVLVMLVLTAGIVRRFAASARPAAHVGGA
jgi:cytochrome c oxidase subunit I